MGTSFSQNNAEATASRFPVMTSFEQQNRLTKSFKNRRHHLVFLILSTIRVEI